MRKRLKRSFYAGDTLRVARGLLGTWLVHYSRGKRLAGRVVEVEAYIGSEDTACHAARGQTARNKVMFGPAGHAYVYFTYGMHWLVNLVTGPDRYPAAVLIRAVVPDEGVEEMSRRRGGRTGPGIADGPAKLCQALGIDGSRLSVISYGNERPAALGSNELAWKQNRRAVFVVN